VDDRKPAAATSAAIVTAATHHGRMLVRAGCDVGVAR
jgi:hypothetical protein